MVERPSLGERLEDIYRAAPHTISHRRRTERVERVAQPDEARMVATRPQQLEPHHVADNDSPVPNAIFELGSDNLGFAVVRPGARIGELYQVRVARSSRSFSGVSSEKSYSVRRRSFSCRTTSSSARCTVSVVPFEPSTSRASATRSRSRLREVRLTMGIS